MMNRQAESPLRLAEVHRRQDDWMHDLPLLIKETWVLRPE
jgi:hypothetical protein